MAHEPRVFRAPEGGDRPTLAAAIRHWIGPVSWGEVRRLIESRRVTISGNLALDPARRLQPGEVVKLLPAPAPRPPGADDVAIQFLDAHLVVVEKPSGVTSVRHPEERNWPARRRQFQPTLEELLPTILARTRGGKSRRGRPLPVRPVHRLDRETSGLLVFARTVEAERGLVRQFSRHTVDRRYLAVVHGSCPAMTIRDRIVRDRGDGRRGITDDPNQGQDAVTHVHPVEALGDYTLIECRLETGRTHQIRIHLASRGHLVCGEPLYHQPCFGQPSPDKSGAPRLALHAARLGFTHPVTGSLLSFDSPVPEDLRLFLDLLRAKPSDD
jgi:23S rRNA pseudouridine1911/1915/1917 synthase